MADIYLISIPLDWSIDQLVSGASPYSHLGVCLFAKKRGESVVNSSKHIPITLKHRIWSNTQ